MCIQAGCSQRAEGETPALIETTEIANALNASDSLFREREDIDKLRTAVKTLANVRHPGARNFEVEWKFAKYSYFLGKRIENADEAEKVFERGRDAGSIASRVAPDRPDGHFWYAANLGELSQLSPITIGLKSVDNIRDALLKVIEIDPGYQGASTYDALGQLELKTRLYGGKASKAVEYLEKGFELNKENANIRVHLAEAYLAVKRDVEARKHLNDLIAMEPNPEYLREHAEAVDKAKKLLANQF